MRALLRVIGMGVMGLMVVFAVDAVSWEGRAEKKTTIKEPTEGPTAPPKVAGPSEVEAEVKTKGVKGPQVGPEGPEVGAGMKGQGHEKQRARLRICTGTPGNNYHRVGLRLADLLKETVDVEVKTTRGSWENLEAIDENRRRCDAVVAQEDAYALHQFERPDSFLTMDRVANLFAEQLHLICNRVIKANFVHELNEKEIEMVVPEFGSGHYVTWKLFNRLNPRYQKFVAGEYSLEEALLRVLDQQRPSCLFLVSKVGGSLRFTYLSHLQS